MFHDGWIEVARFNRIDRRHARPAEQDEQFILMDLSEQFLGAYEYGVLRFAAPIASGNGEAETPTGEFGLTAAHRSHQSCLYMIEGTDRPYPMNYALRFYVNGTGMSYWIHGRDLPGYPASHGCIGLCDVGADAEGAVRHTQGSDARTMPNAYLSGF